MRWLMTGLLLVSPAIGSEEEQWYDHQGQPVEVSAAVANARSEEEWVPLWLAEERARQAQMGRRRWSHQRAWHGHGWAGGGYWIHGGWPRYRYCRPHRWGGVHFRGGGSGRWCVRVNTPGLQVNWCR